MNKKQPYFPKLFKAILILSLMPFYQAFSLGISEDILTADSLFREKKYTESYEIYERVFNKDQQATPQMLMKMAFIKEGLGDPSLALFYLNQYYIRTSDENARLKMENLASEHELVGYDSTDTVYFIWLVNKYFVEFAGLVLAISFFLLGAVIFRKIKKKGTVIPYAVSLVFLLGLFFALLNFQLMPDQGIIIENHAYLMSGPSSGSDLIDVVKKGHRVQVLDDDGVWIKVDWQGQDAYIRKSKIRPLS